MLHRNPWIRLAACALLAGTLAGGRCDDHQTNPPATIHVTGTLTTEGVECRTLRGSDGKLYTLTGDLKGFKPGDEVCITARPVEVSYCMQGITVAVVSIKPASECR